MSFSSRHRAELWTASNKYPDTSPERTKIWIEPKSSKPRIERRAAVVYYLSRNGVLDHPHFIEVPLSSPEGGLFLRDVINKLNSIRGPGMANMYSWSSKRNYKSGYVWQDLCENDFIFPCHGHEYILKGTRLLESSSSFRSCETVSSKTSSETTNSSTDNHDLKTPATSFSSSVDILGRRKKNQHRSYTSLDDLSLSKPYKAKTAGSVSARRASNASTQTEEKDPQPVKDAARAGQDEELSDDADPGKEETMSLSPPSCSNNSSRELGREILEILEGPREVPGQSADIRNQVVESDRPSGRIKASAILMQLIMCGSKNGDDIVAPQSKQ